MEGKWEVEFRHFKFGVGQLIYRGA